MTSIATPRTCRLAPLLDWVAENQLPTPVHLFSRASLEPAVRRLRDGLGGRISYATKANVHPLMLAAVDPLVDEFNVTNPAHLAAMLTAGVDPARITYLHPVATREAITAALAAGVTGFVVDDERGLDRLLAAHAGRPAAGPLRLTLRVRPPAGDGSGRAVIRFGNTVDALHRVAFQAVAQGAGIEALAFFVGAHPDHRDPTGPYERGIAAVAALHRRLAVDGIPAGAVNVGGGFPGSRRSFHRRNPDFFPRIGALVRDAFPAGVRVVAEPGRYLSEPTMTLVSRVIADRRLAGERLTYLDGSAYGGLFEYAFIDPDPDSLPVFCDRPGDASPTRLLGPVMDSFDVLRRTAELPALAEGDLLAFPGTGAYAWGYTTATEGLRPPPVIPLPADLDAVLATEWTD